MKISRRTLQHAKQLQRKILKVLISQNLAS